MNKFVYVPPDKWSEDEIELSAPKAHHLQRVLRLKHESPVNVFDGKGVVVSGILLLKPKNASLKIVSAPTRIKKPTPEITGIVALLKGERMDAVIEKCTELGISQIIPVVTERTVVALNQEKKTKRANKYKNIVVRASEQSENCHLPVVQEITTIKDALPQLKQSTRLVFCARKQQSSFTTFHDIKDSKDITFLIGPEGGLTDDEITLAASHSFIPTHLGQRVLRADTAAITAMSLLRYANTIEE